MFLDKGNILSNFNHLFDTKNSCYTSLYSHPGMGKTRLIQELSKSRKTLYFKAAPSSFEENVCMLKALCTRQFHKEFQQAKKLTDIFKLLAKHSEQEPLLIIFDDFPHLAAGNRRISTIIASFFNRISSDANLFLILCKPASAYEKECTKEKHTFLLRPFRFFEMRMLYPEMSLEEQILLYSITGGVPAYLQYFNPKVSVRDNIYQLFFQEDGIFYRFVPSRTKEYYSASSVMRSILLSMGQEDKKLQEICDYTELTPSAASSLLLSLSSHNLAERIVPVTEDQSSRRAVYFISDGIFRFWYTYVFPYQSEIEFGQGEAIFNTFVLPALDTYTRNTFETICKEFLVLTDEMGTSPFPMKNVGKWWGQHPTKKRTESIPIAAYNNNKILLGTCFWTDEWIDIDALYKLQKHSSLFPDMEEWYYLFSKSDFVSGFEVISGSHVHVFSLEQMCNIADKYLVTYCKN